MIIGIRGQYRFEQCANAAQAAMILATEGGELCALTDKGFGWGSQQYADAPAEWVSAVAAISETAEFKAAVAAKKADAAAEDARLEARTRAMNAAQAEYGAIRCWIDQDMISKTTARLAEHKAAYSAAVAKHGDIVAHGHIGTAIAEMEKLANGPRAFAVTDDSVIAAVRAGKHSVKDIASAVGAQDDDEVFIVQRKVMALVVKKLLNRDRRDRITAA